MAVYLQEGKHYAALAPDASEREWARRTSRNATDQLEDLIVIADGAEPVANLPEEFSDFEDLIQMDDKNLESTLMPEVQSVPTSTVHQPPLSPAPSSSSASSVDPTLRLLKKLSDDVTSIKAFFKAIEARIKLCRS